MPQHVLDALAAAPVEEVTVLGRRGPAQATFTTQELRELGELAGATVLVDAADLELDPAAEERAAADRNVARNLAVLRGWADHVPEPGRVRLRLRFFARPARLLGEDRVTARRGRAHRRRRRRPRHGHRRARRAAGRPRRPLGRLLRHPAARPAGGRAVGHGAARGRPGAARRDGPRPASTWPAGSSAGPSGVVGTNKHDARETVAALLADAADGHAAPSGPVDDLVDALRGPRRRAGAARRLAGDRRRRGRPGRRAAAGPARRCTSARRCWPPCGRPRPGAPRAATAPPSRSGRLGAVTGPSQHLAQVSPVSFARGAPSLDIVDVAGLRQAAMDAFDADPAGLTGYGTAIGYVPLRQWIAEKHGVPEDHVLVDQRLDAGRRVPVRRAGAPGDAVVAERPTYDRTLLGLKERGAEVHLVTLREDGIDVDEIAALLEAGVRPKLAHIIPNFQNPAGYTLSLAKRAAAARAGPPSTGS